MEPKKNSILYLPNTTGTAQKYHRNITEIYTNEQSLYLMDMVTVAWNLVTSRGYGHYGMELSDILWKRSLWHGIERHLVDTVTMA